MFIHVFLRVAILGCISSLSLAQTSPAPLNGSVVYDNDQMPRCIQNNKNDADGLLFVWKDNDRYERDVRAVRIFEISREKKGCANWASLVKQVEDKRGDVIVDGTTTVAGYDLSALSNALNQIRRGGDVYHPEVTGAEFLTHHPISSFTRETNRELAKKYGIGFTSEIYRAFIDSNSTNQIFAQLVDKKIQTLNNSEPLGERLKNVTVMLANGFMQAPGNDRLKPLADDLRSAGVDVVVFKMNSIAAMESNAQMLAEQLASTLAQGRNVILIGGSKGVPELLAATTLLVPKLDSFAGKISAIINLSGTIEGSFVVDWGLKFPQSIFVKKTLKKQAGQKGIDLNTFDGLEDMSTKHLARFIPNILPALPSQLKYFSIIGIPGGNGLVREKSIAQLQSEVARKRVGSHGANDGYVEFPGTALPKSTGLDIYELTFDASHVILDGHYGKYDMQNESERRLVITSLFAAIADLANIK